MTKTQSENTVTKINETVFYKEFTFDKNEFYPDDGTKELADNVIWLDNLLFVNQIKERNIENSKGNVDNWFKNKVLKKAKNQIKNTIDFLTKYQKIEIKNRKNQTLDISKVENLNNINKLIIYQTQEELSKENKLLKFYESKNSGYIHLFNIVDYYWICEYLITPTELDEYLKFRERIYLKHKPIISLCPEQYILAHFLNTPDETYINWEYPEIFKHIKKDLIDFDFSEYLTDFQNKIIRQEQKSSTNYHSIIKEIAKLKRYELKEFKKRFQKSINDSRSNERKLPYRFASLRTKCGFVFIPVNKQNIDKWEIILRNLTEMFMYKHKLEKCLGIVIMKKGDFFDINWGFMEHQWQFNQELDDLIKSENKILGEPEFKEIERYKTNKK